MCKLALFLALQSKKMHRTARTGFVIEPEMLLLILIFLIYFLFHQGIPKAVYWMTLN